MGKKKEWESVGEGGEKEKNTRNNNKKWRDFGIGT